MRISDWSSDVCSSDQFDRIGRADILLTRENLGICRQVMTKRCGEFDRHLDGLFFSDGAQFELRHRVTSYGSKTRSLVTRTRTGKPGRMVKVGAMLSCRCKIGRASCRERVCQYV